MNPALLALALAAAAPSPTPTYPLEHWRALDCSQVEETVAAICRKAHRSFGLGDAPEGDAGTPAPSETLPTALLANIAAPLEDDEAAKATIDRMLASSLKDPTSPIQYRVSRVIPCTAILPPDMQQKAVDCICYSVNAKNSWGAYGGAKLGAAELIGTSGHYMTINIPPEIVRTSTCMANLAPRSADMIKDAAK